MTTEETIQILRPFLTENRSELFEKVINQRTRKLTVVLEDIYDPHNANAVIRSCDCFGIQDSHLIEVNSNFQVSRHVTTGSVKWLNVFRYRQFAAENRTKGTLDQLKSQGYKIVATTPHTQNTPDQISFDKPIALVMGNESVGISKTVMEEADELVQIPMLGFTESFNLSVATALFFQTFRAKLEKEYPGDYFLSQDEKNEILLDWMKKTVKSSEAILGFHSGDNSAQVFA
ncbi:MAG: tRNA (guanosine-2'-O-)-methyltransferase [Sphingobacteriales bacterium]|jgi:tRNA (guanosine-2'-O-)-methyltransferase